MLIFPDTNENQEETKSVTENAISDGNEMDKSNNENAGQLEYASVEDSLNMLRIAINETTLISESPNIINEENVMIAPGQGKSPDAIFGDELCEEQAFAYLLPKGKFDYSVPRDNPISPAPCFNQRLLNFNQHFASDTDSIFFSMAVYEQHHLRSSRNFVMHKLEPGLPTEGTVEQF